MGNASGGGRLDGLRQRDVGEGETAEQVREEGHNEEGKAQQAAKVSSKQGEVEAELGDHQGYQRLQRERRADESIVAGRQASTAQAAQGLKVGSPKTASRCCWRILCCGRRAGGWVFFFWREEFI